MMRHEYHRSEDYSREFRREEPIPARRERNGPMRNTDGGRVFLSRRISRSRSRTPLLRELHNRRERDRGFRDTFQRDREFELNRRRDGRSRSKSRHTGTGPPPLLSRPIRLEPARLSGPTQKSGEGRGRNVGRGGTHSFKTNQLRGHGFEGKGRSNNRSAFGDLDRAVKRAREERGSSYWNKKVMEAEEKDSNRWGHSGYKELYRNEKSRGSTLLDSRRQSRSPLSSRANKTSLSSFRSRSRSPRSHWSTATGEPRKHGGNPSTLLNANSRQNEKTSDHGYSQYKETQSANEKHQSNTKRRDAKEDSRSEISRTARPKKTEKKLSSVVSTPQNTYSKTHQSRLNAGGELKQDDVRQKQNKNSSVSDSSRSRTPSPQLKSKITKPVRKEDKEERPNASNKSRSSSSGGSTSDEDVLEIHAWDHHRRTLSRSVNSSDEETISDESVRKKRSSRSSVSSNVTDSSAKISQKRKDGKRDSAHGKESSSKATTEKNIKPVSSNKKKSSYKQSAKETALSDRATRRSKSIENGSTDTDGDSESETASTTESEDEPKMTLSERFAKLTQMSRDKREFAKPEILISDIDTKLKVVKDLRNADTKVFVNQTLRPASTLGRALPKSPEAKDGDARHSSSDRHQHFERMNLNEPGDVDRPSGWSDVRVRYNYYKRQGCFDERPLTLDEYVKWEAWWYEYRDWLAEEGYYDQRQLPQTQYAGRPSPEGRKNNWRLPFQNQLPAATGPRGLQNFGNGFQPPQPEPLFGRHFHGRPFQDNPPEEPVRVPVSRRIGHVVGGSLVVNVRQPRNQGSFRGGKGRLAGRIGFRR